MTRSEPWQIAVDIEKLAHAIDNAGYLLANIDPSAFEPIFDAAPDITAIDGDHMFKALMALSNKYQAIADAEPDEPVVEWEGPLTDAEQGMIDAAWEKHKAAAPLDACPHAAPLVYCAECVATPCPVGLGGSTPLAQAEGRDHG